MAALPVIIDCDPGQDDAIAIFLALAAPELLEVRAITAVAGNVPLAKTQRNARILTELAGRGDVPVYAGCPRPLVRQPLTAEHVHGPEGIDGLDLFEPKRPIETVHAVDYLIEELTRCGEGGLTIVAVGPLTNLAVALVKAPKIAAGIKELVIMGGAGRAGGNRTPTAEFNFLADPHAAHVVLQCGRPITVMSLDITHQAITTPKRLAAIEALDNGVAQAAAAMLGFYDTDRLERYGARGSPLHDPLTIAYLLAPRLFEGRHLNVEIDIVSELSFGSSRVDWWGVAERPANVMWMDRLDADGFYSLLTERLGSFGSN